VYKVELIYSRSSRYHDLEQKLQILQNHWHLYALVHSESGSSEKKEQASSNSECLPHSPQNALQRPQNPHRKQRPTLDSLTAMVGREFQHPETYSIQV
jgi:hypothetical protein